MNDSELVCRLLYRVLIEIRLEGVESHNKKVYDLADLFHNVPMEIKSKVKDDDLTESMSWIRRRAEQKGMSGWLNHSIEDIKKNKK